MLEQSLSESIESIKNEIINETTKQNENIRIQKINQRRG